MKLLLLYRRRWLLFYGPVLLLTLAALWWSVAGLRVLAPQRVVIAAGPPQGSYSPLAQRYGEALERNGIRVEIIYSDTLKGSIDQLLAGTPNVGQTASGGATVGFAHGIYVQANTPLRALAVVGQEPVWVFARIGGPMTLAQASGLRVAAGAESSSSLRAARLMLDHAGIKPGAVVFQPLSGVEAANALADSTTDIVILAAGEDSDAVQLLTRMPGVMLLGTDKAGALAAQEPALQPLLLPQGSIELRGDIPPKDLTLMSLQTHLLVAAGTHPALQRALLDVATDIHEIPTFLQRHGQFPSFRGSDFPLSPTARAYSLGSRPWLETQLPYGTAQKAELLLFVVLPILLAAYLLLVWIPRLFDWRIRAALNYFYGELNFLESDMGDTAANNPMGLRRLLERLDEIERQVSELDIPDAKSDDWYTLRSHLSAARERLLKLRAR